MPTSSTEDTMIGSQNLLLRDPSDNQSDQAAAKKKALLERCRTTFLTLGERVNSFDLSRQIYG